MFNMLGGNVDDYVSLGYFRGYDPCIDAHSLYLEDLPRKIMWTTFSSHSYDFSKAFVKVKRILIVFGVNLLLPITLCFLNCGLTSLINSCVF